MKPLKENLWISVNQASGRSEYAIRVENPNYQWDMSGAEPGLWPRSFYDDYPDDKILQCFKQLNHFIREDAAAQQFDGRTVSCDIALPEGLDYDQAKEIFIAQGFEVPTVANWFSGTRTLTIKWTNFVIPEGDESKLEGSKRFWDPSLDTPM